MDFPTPKARIALANDREGILSFLPGQLLQVLALFVFPLTKFSLEILLFCPCPIMQRFVIQNFGLSFTGCWRNFFSKVIKNNGDSGISSGNALNVTYINGIFINS